VRAIRKAFIEKREGLPEEKIYQLPNYMIFKKADIIKKVMISMST